MSYASDTLKALAGLLHILEACFKCQIKEGLPEILLDAAILWRPMEALERRSVSEVDIPSWSWAGWKGKVRYDEPFRVEDSHGSADRRGAARSRAFYCGGTCTRQAS
jgi:hypothetical protein